MRKELIKLQDDDLVARYISGCNLAFETLLYRHKQKIYAQINNYVKDRFTADDIFQEVFIKIASTLKNKIYRSEGRFNKWLGIITYNCCMDYFRSKRNSTQINYCFIEEVDEIADTLSTADLHLFEKEQQKQLLSKMLNKLPEEQREILFLRYYAELQFKQIAKIVDCPLNTALGRMRYGLKTIRRTVEKNKITL